jgi:hypothetical protein
MKHIGQREQGPRRNSFWDILVGNGSPLGPKRRLLALIVVAGGILTFFLPLISTQPPVLQTSDWGRTPDLGGEITRPPYFDLSGVPRNPRSVR